MVRFNVAAAATPARAGTRRAEDEAAPPSKRASTAPRASQIVVQQPLAKARPQGRVVSSAPVVVCIYKVTNSAGETRTVRIVAPALTPTPLQ